MEVEEITKSIHEIQNKSKSYPDFVRGLIAFGIDSYTVDVASQITLYRRSDGSHGVKYPEAAALPIAARFNLEATKKAIRDTQQGKTDFPTFIQDIAKSGVRFYEATLSGNHKRVTYIGRNGCYVEEIPLDVST